MAKKEKTDKTDNGALLFEKMGKDFIIPGRIRSGAYDEVIELLKGTAEVVCVFRSAEARPCNVRRKSLLTAAEKAGLKIHAAVRANKETGENLLLAQVAPE